MQKAAPRLLIAGTNSGCGKTTVTCAILQALVDGGVSVAAAKCGPDYIDPMFHREIIGAKSSNLDPFFFDDDTLRFFVSQVGRHRETRRDSSWSPGHGAFGGVSERVERDDSVDAHELSMLPRGTAVIQPLGCRPVLARTLHFTRRGWYSPDGPREGGGR